MLVFGAVLVYSHRNTGMCVSKMKANVFSVNVCSFW